ncbi:MAG TPA: hypothetical protein VK087_02825 [Tissierellaceae bacterium]|nr:hypothetical protein [Tissierellaceae bacterium]
MDKKDMIFIGVIESNKNKKTINTIESVLIKFDYNIIYTNEFKNILYLKYENKIIVIININLKYMDYYKGLGIRFDILIHNFMNRKEYNKEIFIPPFRECKYYIINSDDPNWNLLPINSVEGAVINYGYNNKSTLTISSHNIENIIKANLYLQRELETFRQDKIDPFEFTIEINSQDKWDIYPVLAATALNLILFNEKVPIKYYKTIKI